jgi:hypothetical protein
MTPDSLGEVRPRVVSVNGKRVTRLLDAWAVHDRWWTPQPLRREFIVVELEHGVSCDLFRENDGAWQRVPTNMRR